MKLLIVAGARPNFMKIAPLIHKIKKFNNLSYKLVHTGQHYDYKMSETFFIDLDIHEPDYFLDVGSGTHAEQTGKIMVAFETVCIEYKPDFILVVGDVNSTLACSITAKKLNIKVAHIEAGLRSNDLTMPEEINRLVTDSISDLFFITENDAYNNLINEGVSKDKIYNVGNLMIDTLHYGLDKIKSKDRFYDKPYGVITLHRPANVDNENILIGLLDCLNTFSKEIELFLPLHPRTENAMKKYNLEDYLSSSIKILPPASYLQFIHMIKSAKVIFTDSGGIQEEATVLKVPCYTLRNNTERPVTIELGTNRLATNNKEKVIELFNQYKYDINNNYKIPENWDGNASKRILTILDQLN